MSEAEVTPPRTRFAGGVLWGVLVVVVVGIGLVRLCAGGGRWQALESEVRPLGEVPDFALVERSGQQVTKADLLGKVWVVSFIFTRCVDACPSVSSRMVRLQETFTLEEDVRWVSITVDPEHDTPEILSRYAERFGAHPQRWWFLTGDQKAIYRLVQDGFHLGVVDPNGAGRRSAVPISPRFWQAMRNRLQVLKPGTAWAHHGSHRQGETPPDILHSARFVLVDRQGQIRGYYDSREEDAMRRLRRHVAFLLREDT